MPALIATHSGPFHADDVMAVGLIRAFHDPSAKVVRTRDLARIAEAGVDVVALAEKLQIDGRDSFDAAWKAMIADIGSKADSIANG